MITIRRYQPSDAAAVDEIYNRCHSGTFGRPNLNNVLTAAVVLSDDVIIGFGCLEFIAEAVMIIDTDRRPADRITALKELINTAKFTIKDRPFDRFYIFPSDTKFEKILQKHFHMDKCTSILCCEVEK